MAWPAGVDTDAEEVFVNDATGTIGGTTDVEVWATACDDDWPGILILVVVISPCVLLQVFLTYVTEPFLHASQ